MNIASIFNDELNEKTEQIAEEYGAVPVDGQDVDYELIEDPLPEVEPSEEFEVPTGKKKLKKEIIADILELQEKIGGNEFSENMLNKTKKEELEKILAISFEKLTKKNAIKESKNKQLCDPMVQNLFMVNILFAGILEQTGTALKHKTENINLMEGLKDSFQENESELKQILKRIYEENTEVINQYCSASTLYLAFLSRQVAFTAMNNLKKKKLNSSENQEEPED